jgi:hypothetical protein
MANRITPIDRTRRTAPNEVYFVVRSSGIVGRRDHEVISPLYETRWQAAKELARLRSGMKRGVLSVHARSSAGQPPEWLSDVVLSDGTIVRAPR